MQLRNKLAVGFGIIGIVGSGILADGLPNNSKIVLNNGIPKWPITYVSDLDGDGTPEIATDYLVGLGPAPAYKNIRTPTQKEIGNFKSQK